MEGQYVYYVEPSLVYCTSNKELFISMFMYYQHMLQGQASYHLTVPTLPTPPDLSHYLWAQCQQHRIMCLLLDQQMIQTMKIYNCMHAYYNLSAHLQEQVAQYVL